MSKERNGAVERIRHASWAGLVALGLAFSTLLVPLDQFNWMMQARFANFEASGDIVYVRSNQNLTDENAPERRIALAETLDRLRNAGVDRVYVTMSFDASSTPAADARLRQALNDFEGKAFLVENISSGMNGQLQMTETTPAIGQDIPLVASLRWRNFLGYVWDVPFTVNLNDRQYPSLAASIAGMQQYSGEFRINYGFDLASIPSYRVEDLSANKGPLGIEREIPQELAGKVLVLGSFNRSDAVDPNIPGQMEVPAPMIDIYAAETLKAGYTQRTESQMVALIVLALLFLLSQIGRKAIRYTGYGLLIASLPVALLVTAQMGLMISIVGALVLLGLYGLMRARANWRSNYRMVDADTGLPTFAALENDKTVADTVPAIIVARIHRFEEVRKTLPTELHAEYLLRIVGRLKAAKKDAVIYLGQGHSIAWTFPEKEPALIRDHLEGLRALFSSPLLVGENQVDVGITFGVDITPSPNVARRLAAALDAAERTTETYDPILIAELASDEDLIWNISLQARIDTALSNGEIYTIYQPKVLVRTGELIGVEALVRWRDPVKGLIPPDHFIRQCENAGRMSHLTRHVLAEACRAGNAFAANGLPLAVAVNISATLVHERDVVRMVSEVLAETGFDAQLLTLEITETYRISNHDRAAEVLGELAALGPKISMDDFGVGAASLEALQRLPFHEIKIDRLFTSAIKDDPKALAIVRSVLSLGKDLRIIVVAEGVEDEATLTILRDSGCVVAQGFAISRPISFDEILKFQQLDPQTRKANMV
ncbi:EAL domain-containing protein [Altererythrobacter sp. KTW20L]|uniref:EAL domain-containing protein n=1 Tax=Altererythrobacter sp. KTW20L TaxID=2942210 RepID=UPI0020C107B5|nr:EAL domain-containing protein [Altererythrobacter sp. KTW20L]MCL6251453.1 EAL domain-containing protein [Altererythrobacter sp. KTW20L]